MLSSHFIGEITEQQVAVEFLKLGILISKPLVQSSKYDFIADINHKLYKIHYPKFVDLLLKYWLILQVQADFHNLLNTMQISTLRFYV